MNNRLTYIDILKSISIIGVVFIHVCCLNFFKVTPGEYEFKIYNIYDSCFRWCVPIFVMCSGMSFLDVNNEKITTKNIFKKYIFKLLTVIVFWGTVYFLFSAYLNNDSINIKDIIRCIMTGNVNYHLWFLFMLVGLYIIAPIVRIYVGHATRKNIEYFLVISIIFTSILPLICNVESVGNLLNPLIKALMIKMPTGYILYFVLGYYLKKYEIKKSFKNIIYILAIFSLLLTIIITQKLSLEFNTLKVEMYEYLNINVLIMSIAIIIFVKSKYNNYLFKEKTKQTFYKLSKYSFGVYLVHDIFLKILSKYNFLPNFINPILGVPIIVIIILTLSLIVTISINKIPYINKYII